ncbi:RNA polymerase sigma-70 factor [Paraflavitalea sp. CAU 1676]|uniref:RNA polymerase sigma factor n=1 Tax=Paraflavitalea sp. CAU 1676 TaxID=3032598 RepID=UPI0023DA1C2E|nr:RNA polymerase sigma-70 factor [Paraflavitalea sp. CAU 1676]MDF2188203.1 RNA polymerase sigma-70 factor [Paraflavitalea sp. CAU 1676]
MPINPLHNEKELLSRIAGGDGAAFEQLFDYYWQGIYEVAFTLTKSREIARDMVQEIFLKLWLVREELPHKDNFTGFLFIVARNHIYDELRKKLNEQPFATHLQTWFTESPLGADQRLLYQESQTLVHKAIAQLPEQQRQVYLLTRESGWTQDEIAQHLQVSKNTVKTHMSRALTAIREYLLTHAQGILLIMTLLEIWQ